MLLAVVNLHQTGELLRAVMPLCIALFTGVSELLSRRNPRHGLIFLCVGIWLVACVSMWRFAGVRSAYVILFPFLLALTGWVMGRRWLTGLTLLTISYITALGLAEWSGHYHPASPPTTLLFSASAVVVIAVTTFLTLSVYGAFQRINTRLMEVTDAMLAHNAELAVRENDMEFLVNAMPVRMAIIGSDFRIALANASMLEVYGMTIEQLKGQPVDDVMVSNADSEAPPAWARAKRGEFVRYLSIIERHAPRPPLIHQVTLIPKLINGKIDIIVVVAQDISDLYQANQAIQALNETLEQRVEARTQELAQTMEHLNMAREELVQSEAKATLGAMVASITHEMGTPIGNSMMTAGTLRDQVDGFRQSVGSGQLRRSELEATLQALTTGVGLIARNLERANGLLHSFKQGAADQFTEQRREFDLAETLGEILTLLRPTLRKAAHQIRVDIPPGLVFNSYPGPLGQVFINLINNAWLHGFEGMSAGELSISAAPLAHAPDQIRVVIADNGVGMSAEVQAKLFEPFFSTKIGKGGTGLGMSIVEGIVRKTLGGAMDVESAPGQGTRYTLTLPLRVMGD